MSQKIEKFVDLQVKANQAIRTYGDIPNHILEEIMEISMELSEDEHIEALNSLVEIMTYNDEIAIAELN